MNRIFRSANLLAFVISTAAGMSACPPANAASSLKNSHSVAVAHLFTQFMLPSTVKYSAGDWDMTRSLHAVRWGKGPILLEKPTPEGEFFALPGQIDIGGRTAVVVANGARAMVSNYYLLDPAPSNSPEEAATGFKAAGFGVEPARCPIDGHGYPDTRRWYHITYPGKRDAYLYTTPIKTGGSGYVLFIGNLPTMNEKDSAVLSDSCSNTASPADGFRTGTQAVVALIDRLIRPTSAAASLPWATLETLPALKWKMPPMHLTIPYSEGGDDPNPYTLGGSIETPTTQSEMRATGTAKSATHYYFRYLDHIPKDAVFNQLRAKGYRITAARCGKPYTKMSENWFSVTAPGKRPAILYRAFSYDQGPTKTSFVLRIDNIMPPIEQGQRPAPRSGCPG